MSSVDSDLPRRVIVSFIGFDGLCHTERHVLTDEQLGALVCFLEERGAQMVAVRYD